MGGSVPRGRRHGQGRGSSNTKKGIDNNRKLCYTTDVPTGSRRLGSVHAFSKEGQPVRAGPLSFVAAFSAKCAPDSNTHAAESLSQDGGAHFAGPTAPAPTRPARRRFHPRARKAPCRFPVRALPRSALCSRSLERYTHPLTPALLLGPRRSGPVRGTPRRSPRPLARAGLRIVPPTGPLHAFWLGLLPSQCLGYRLARAGEARCTAR